MRLEVVCMVVNSRCFDPKKKELAYSIYSYIYIYIPFFWRRRVGSSGTGCGTIVGWQLKGRVQQASHQAARGMNTQPPHLDQRGFLTLEHPCFMALTASCPAMILVGKVSAVQIFVKFMRSSNFARRRECDGGSGSLKNVGRAQQLRTGCVVWATCVQPTYTLCNPREVATKMEQRAKSQCQEDINTMLCVNWFRGGCANRSCENFALLLSWHAGLARCCV